MFTKEQMLKALKESTEDQQKVFNESWITTLLTKHCTWKHKNDKL